MDIHVVEKTDQGDRRAHAHTPRRTRGHRDGGGRRRRRHRRLEKAVMSEILEFEAGKGKHLAQAMERRRELYGLVLNLEEDGVRAAILGDTARVAEGMTVKSTGTILSVPSGEELLGRVVNALGEPMDGKGPFKKTTMMPVERQAAGVIDRKGVSVPLADRHQSHRRDDPDRPRPARAHHRRPRAPARRPSPSTPSSTSATSRKRSAPSASTSPSAKRRARPRASSSSFASEGALEYTIVVDAPASAPAALQYLAPFAGVAIGEYFMDQGQRRAHHLRRPLQASRRVPRALAPLAPSAGPRSVSGRHFLSPLAPARARVPTSTKRTAAARITALPIIETQEGDVSGYIPTNVISITDGQIFLDRRPLQQRRAPGHRRRYLGLARRL